MKLNNIIEEYLENPENVYEKLSTMDDRSRKIVYLLEELFTEMKFSEIDTAEDEQWIAEMADKLRKNDLKDSLQLQDLQAISDVMMSVKRMSASEKKEVPGVLLSVIERTLQVKEKKEVPSFIIRMTENGIKAIVSGLNGMSLIPVANPVMRSAATLEKEQEDQNIFIEQDIDNTRISYSILKESDSEVMLSLNFSEKIGRCRIFLKENERIISTENLENGEDSVSFRKLKPGFYDITITGSIDHSFSIFIEG